MLDHPDESANMPDACSTAEAPCEKYEPITLPSLEWKTTVCSRGCEVHDVDLPTIFYGARPVGCDGELQAHHALPQQTLRKWALEEWRWDPRLGISVCERAHERHTSAYRRIPRAVLRDETVAIILQLGFDRLLDLHYPEGWPAA